MQTWLNFWTFFFFVSLSIFIFNPTNFISLILYSEITWLTLFMLAITCGALNDDATLTSLTFFILGLAGVEFIIGFLLLIFFKNTNNSYILNSQLKVNEENLFNNKTFLNIERYFWI